MSSIQSRESVHRRQTVTRRLQSPLVGTKRNSVGIDSIELGNGKVVQMRIDDFGERGAPEGQEDPPQLCETPSKCSVLKSEKPKFPSLYVNGLNVDPKSQQVVLNKIQLEMEQRQRNNVWNKHLDVRTSLLINTIKKNLTLNTEETIYKVYKMLSTGGSRLFIVITNRRLCVLISNLDTQQLEVCYSSNFTNLDLIALGPYEQTALFVSEKSKKCTIITAVDVRSALEMIGSLEYAYRRSGLYDPKSAFVVINLCQDDKLYESVKSQISIPKDEKIQYYTWLWCSKERESLNEYHLEEFLMVKKDSVWKPRFVRLSEFVLYLFDDPDQNIPCETIPLRFGHCKRVEKICSDRPHSIEILLISSSIILAPADCSQEEKWFSALNYAMKKPKYFNVETKLPDGYCCLLTNSHIVLYNFPYTITDSMLLVNIDLLKYSPSTSHYYVVIEWSCCDATLVESSDDWVVHFSCKSSYDEFISWLCMLNPDLNTIKLTDQKSIKRHSENNSLLLSTLF